MTSEKPTNTSILNTHDLEYTFQKIDIILKKARENSLGYLEIRVQHFIAANERYYVKPLRWDLCVGSLFLFAAFIVLLYTNLPWLSGRYGIVQFLMPFIYLGTSTWLVVEAVRHRTKTLRCLKLLTEPKQGNTLERLRCVRRSINVLVTNNELLPHETQHELDRLFHDVELYTANNLTAIVKDLDNV